ncbi:hypothetical protein ACLB0R_04540 [Sphingomonas sp. GlSt437]
MKLNRFSEDELIDILKGAEAGAVVMQLRREARNIERELLCMGGQVRRA